MYPKSKRFQETPDKCRGITTAMLAGWEIASF